MIRISYAGSIILANPCIPLRPFLNKLCRINPPSWVNPALLLSGPEKYGILSAWENHRAKAATLHHGGANPPDQKGNKGRAMITYQDFFLFCTFVVALISLIYQILKDERK